MAIHRCYIRTGFRAEGVNLAEESAGHFHRGMKSREGYVVRGVVEIGENRWDLRTFAEH
ncbi:MAG: hypothetical protein N3G20_07220 [Verrucomicrobiae bacterium]|nr:hypothetical protein [Verrucomicrobiae bacterium]